MFTSIFGHTYVYLPITVWVCRPFTNYTLIPMAEQCLYDLQEVIALYNDEALLYQIGSTGVLDGGMDAENLFGGLGAYGEAAEDID